VNYRLGSVDPGRGVVHLFHLHFHRAFEEIRSESAELGDLNLVWKKRMIFDLWFLLAERSASLKDQKASVSKGFRMGKIRPKVGGNE